MTFEPGSFSLPRNTIGKSIIEAMRRDPVRFAEFVRTAPLEPYHREYLRALARSLKPRKFKHNRRG